MPYEDHADFDVVSSGSDKKGNTSKFSIMNIAKPLALTARRRDLSCDSDISEVASEAGGVRGR